MSSRVLARKILNWSRPGDIDKEIKGQKSSKQYGTLYSTRTNISQKLITFNLSLISKLLILEILIERFKPAPLPFPIKNRIVEYAQLAIDFIERRVKGVDR